jgi:hypothetical protein
MNGNQYYIKATVELLAAVFIIISTGLFIFSLWSLIGATNQT